MDRLEVMSMLIASVEAGSFSAASRKLGVPLPTISRNIAELEAHLKTRLLVRTTRKLTLTEAGVAYLTACKRILEQVGDAEAEASGEYRTPRGELTVTAPIVFGRTHVLPVVNDFLARYPDINVRMILSDRNLDLIDEHIDLAVRVAALSDSGLIAIRVGSIRRVVCGSPKYFAAHGIPRTPRDVADLSCVTFDGPPAFWTFSSERLNQLQTVRPRCRLNIDTADAAVDAAIAGVGITHVLSYQISRAVETGKLQVVLEEYELEPTPVYLLHTGQGLLPVKMRSFLEFAAPHLRKSLAEDESRLAAGGRGPIERVGSVRKRARRSPDGSTPA
jgi:DNA-binding transcriptional LysR family regulator